MDYKSVSDTELWRHCRQNDLKAYNELFDRYAKPLYRQAVRYVKDAMVAEELVMDLLFNLWQKRFTLNPDAANNMRVYLMQAMRNRIINHLHKNIPVSVFGALQEREELVESRQADSEIILKDLNTIYQLKLNTLSPQRQKVFRLSREENLSYTEIAQRMNLSVNTVENYMVAALKVLRKGICEYFLLLFVLFFHTLT